MILTSNVGYAFLLTAFAGLSTGIGSLIAYFFKKPKMSFLSVGLGLSAGVMTYVSFVELLPEGIHGLSIPYGADKGEMLGVIIFFLGIAFIMLIDFLIPEAENPHHPVNVETNEIVSTKHDNMNGSNMNNELMKTGLLTAVAIGIHNFPEGLAAFGTALSDINLGIVIAIAVAIHNIPEGISVSLPIYFATGNKKKAFWWSFLSGFAEPLGAFVGYLILIPFLNNALIGGLLCFISGIMVYISLDEILPTAHHYGHGHEVVIGVIIGMGIMALSLLLL